MSQFFVYNSIAVIILLAIWTAEISSTPSSDVQIVYNLDNYTFGGDLDYPSDTHSGAENMPIIQLVSYGPHDKTSSSRATGKAVVAQKALKSRIRNDLDEDDDAYEKIAVKPDYFYTMQNLYAYQDDDDHEDDQQDVDFDDIDDAEDEPAANIE